MVYMEHPIKMDDLGVPPFSETPIWLIGIECQQCEYEPDTGSPGCPQREWPFLRPIQPDQDVQKTSSRSEKKQQITFN